MTPGPGRVRVTRLDELSVAVGPPGLPELQVQLDLELRDEVVTGLGQIDDRLDVRRRDRDAHLLEEGEQAVDVLWGHGAGSSPQAYVSRQAFSLNVHQACTVGNYPKGRLSVELARDDEARELGRSRGEPGPGRR